MDPSNHSSEVRYLNYLSHILKDGRPASEAGRLPALATHTAALSTAHLVSTANVATVVRKPPVARLLVASTITRNLAIRPTYFDPKLLIKNLPTFVIPVVPPGPRNEQPITAGNFLLWPDNSSRQVFFLSAQPTLQELSIIVQRDSDFRTAGGNVTLVAGILPTENLDALARHHDEWTNVLVNNGLSRRRWKFLPLQLSQLEGMLDLPDDHMQSAPRVTANAHLGTAIFMVDLTPLGARAFQDALTSQSPLPGVCQLTARFSGQDQSRRLSARRQIISAPLQTLAAGVGPEAILTINPEVEVDATLLVDGHPTIDAVTVEMRASTGETQTQVFGSDGGTVILRLSSQDPTKEQVEWSVRVSFTSATWPAVRASGVLSNATGWADLINPTSWIRQLSVTMMLIDNAGNVIPQNAASDSDPNNRVTGSVDFSASFLEGETTLQTTFETSSQQSATILLPRPPGTAPGQLKLTAFALRDGRDGLLVRELQDDEQWAVIKVYSNARIEMVTNRSPITEGSTDDVLSETIKELAPREASQPVMPAVAAEQRWASTAAPPQFTIDPGLNQYWALEITTDAALFQRQNGYLRTRDNFWSSADNQGATLHRGSFYRLPSDVWNAYRHVARLYYRIWTSRAADHWDNPQTSIPNALALEAPYIDVVHY